MIPQLPWIRDEPGVADLSAKNWAVKGAGLRRVQLPPGNWFAPPRRSNRGGSGGNKAVGASMERVVMGESDNGQRLLGQRLGVFYIVAV